MGHAGTAPPTRAGRLTRSPRDWVHTAGQSDGASPRSDSTRSPSVLGVFRTSRLGNELPTRARPPQASRWGVWIPLDIARPSNRRHRRSVGWPSERPDCDTAAGAGQAAAGLRVRTSPGWGVWKTLKTQRTPANVVTFCFDMDADRLKDIPAQDPGDAFEEACWGLLRRRYPPERLVYLPADMGGDCGVEGFSTDGIAYQCYADRDSQTLRHRTDKQKSKLYADTVKLQTYAAKLEGLLGGLVLEYYFLMVPEFHAIELVAYASKRAEAVRDYGLKFISKAFAIRIKKPQDYPAELRAALQDGAVKAVVPEPRVGEGHVDLFSDKKPELVKVLDAKLAVLKAKAPGADVSVLRDRFIRAFLAKEQVMESLREWPDTWEAVERRRQLRQEILELESELSPETPDRRVISLMKDYEGDLVTNVAGVRQADAQRLAMGQTGEWLMRCPLRFRALS